MMSLSSKPPGDPSSTGSEGEPDPPRRMWALSAPPLMAVRPVCPDTLSVSAGTCRPLPSTGSTGWGSCCCCLGSSGYRQTHTHILSYRQTHTYTELQADTNIYRVIGTHKQKYTELQADTNKYVLSYRQTQIYTELQADTNKYILSYRQTQTNIY